MSHSSPHVYRGFNVRFDELEPLHSITMSHATWAALEQLEDGSEDHIAKRYQVKAKPKFADGEHKLDSTYATEHEAKVRARTLKEAGHDVEVVPPVEATEPPVSLARYRVETQLYPTTPFARESTWNTEAEAQVRAKEWDDKGMGVRIVDSSNGAIVPNVYPDGTAVAPEADMRTDDEKAHDAQLQPETRVNTAQPVTDPAFPGQPPCDHVYTGNRCSKCGQILQGSATETPSEEWLRKEKEAKAAQQTA